jgi:hypothetical protein
MRKGFVLAFVNAILLMLALQVYRLLLYSELLEFEFYSQLIPGIAVTFTIWGGIWIAGMTFKAILGLARTKKPGKGMPLK